MSLATALSRVEEALGGLASAIEADLGFEDDEALEAAVLDIWKLGDTAALAITEVVAEWNSRALFTRDGSLAAGARLARDTGCRKATADRVVRRGKYLRAHPASLQAARDSALNPDQTDILTRAATPARRRLFDEVEKDRLEDAERLGADDFDRVMRYWSDAADDLLGRDRTKGQSEARHLTMAQTPNGSWHIDGLLDPIAGDIVNAELERITQELWEEDWAEAKEKFGAVVTTDSLCRTYAQRRADALAIMAARSAATPAGSRAPRPLFSVEVDLGTAKRICQLANGTVVTPGMLAPYFNEADFERIVFGPNNRVIEISHRSRFFRDGLRRAIELRDKHCTFPGCTVPASRCDVDHVVEFCDGGVTTQANGRLRCPQHNRQRPGRTSQPTNAP